jgi:hypothetical protein
MPGRQPHPEPKTSYASLFRASLGFLPIGRSPRKCPFLYPLAQASRRADSIIARLKRSLVCVLSFASRLVRAVLLGSSSHDTGHSSKAWNAKIEDSTCRPALSPISHKGITRQSVRGRQRCYVQCTQKPGPLAKRQPRACGQPCVQLAQSIRVINQRVVGHEALEATYGHIVTLEPPELHLR